MFYAEEKINSILNCKRCSRRFEQPKILPCGNTICDNCIGKKNELYSCFFCGVDHVKPTSGEFPINKSIMELLSYSPNDIYRGKPAELLKSSLGELQTQIDGLELSLSTGVDKIKDLCFSLRIDLDLATESTMTRIAELRDAFLRKINLYEVHTIESFHADVDTSKEFAGKIEQLRKFHRIWSDYLKQPIIDDGIIEKSTEAAKSLKENADIDALKLNAFIFNKEAISFEKASEECLQSSILGTLRTKSLLKTFLKQIKSIEIGAYIRGAKLDTIEIDHLDNGSFYIVYTTGENLLKCLTLQIDNMTLDSSFNFEYKYSFLKSLRKYRDTIVASSYGSGAYHIDILNLSLVRVSYNNLYDVCKNSPESFLSVNETHVYYYVKTKQLPLFIFRKEQGYLSFEQNIGQACDPLLPFYLPESIKQFDCQAGRFYWLSGSHLNILDSELGNVINSIEVRASRFLFNSKRSLVLFNEATREINYFDGDLNLVDSVCVENAADMECLLFLGQFDEPFLFDKALKRICFYRRIVEYSQ